MCRGPVRYPNHNVKYDIPRTLQAGLHFSSPPSKCHTRTSQIDLLTSSSKSPENAGVRVGLSTCLLPLTLMLQATLFRCKCPLLLCGVFAEGSELTQAPVETLLSSLTACLQFLSCRRACSQPFDPFCHPPAPATPRTILRLFPLPAFPHPACPRSQASPFPPFFSLSFRAPRPARSLS